MRGGTRLFVCLLSLFGSVCCFRSPTPPTHAPGPATPFPPTGAETLSEQKKKRFVEKAHVEICPRTLSLSFSIVLLASTASRWLVEDFFFFFFSSQPRLSRCLHASLNSDLRQSRQPLPSTSTATFGKPRPHTHTHTGALEQETRNFRDDDAISKTGPSAGQRSALCETTTQRAHTRAHGARETFKTPTPDPSELEHQPDEQESRFVVASTDAQQATTTVRCSPSQRRGQQQSAGGGCPSAVTSRHSRCTLGCCCPAEIQVPYPAAASDPCEA